MAAISMTHGYLHWRHKENSINRTLVVYHLQKLSRKSVWKVPKWNTAFQVVSFSGTYPGAMERLKRQPSCFTGRDIQTDICVPFLQSDL